MATLSTPPAMRWDIFCQVIDNYGDIGVCWRLARQLASEHGLAVRLWLDDLASLQALCPEIDVDADAQSWRNIEIRRWKQPFPAATPAEVVVEAFGCQLPEPYVASMALCPLPFKGRDGVGMGVVTEVNRASTEPIPFPASPLKGEECATDEKPGEQDAFPASPSKGDECATLPPDQVRGGLSASGGEGVKPVWINLEYLSAESWVDSYHGLPSPHPRLPLTKYFFFPGFTPASGGLLREQGLLSQRDMRQRSPAALWQVLNLPRPAGNETSVSLFCYDSAPVAGLLDAWAASAAPVRCLLPAGKVLARVAAHFGEPALAPGDVVRRGGLTVQVIPFLRQEDYDLLLWACDCNFVRGEDSFVRAQWAAKPMLWQIYPQRDNAHQAKLDAFLDRYCAGLAEDVASAARDFHHAWNGNGHLNWEDFWRHRAALQAHAAAWSEHLAAEADLASKLVIFCKNRV